ncbi:MICOS complex subunit MIC13 [Hetaerina americana]|uniref:MICOS complex subunit MIC13 n=1 Tax=Hetaerina americana TaxID=62018 RepID=UPI003A7F1F9E
MLPNEEKLSPGGKMAYRFLKFNAKALIAGGSVYMTAKCGVWGSSQQTADLYKKSHECVTSMINDNAIKVADVPDSREIVAACQHYWNKGVIFTISSIMILPTTLKKWSKELYKQVADNLSGGESSKS